MKAVVCSKHGPPSSLSVQEIPSPKPKANEVVISVVSAGVNFPDTLIIQGKYQFQPPLPFVPGGEVAGVIKEIGPGVTSFKVGQRVVAMTGWGGFAEEVATHQSKVIPLPDSMDFVTGSAFTMTYGTTYHAYKDRAELKAGETVLVLGAAGGVGIAAVELAKAMGAKVIACASNDTKLETAKKFGADFVVNYNSPDWEKKIKQVAPNGVDVVYDPVGGDFAEKAIRQLAWKGRYLVIGFAAGSIPAIKLNLLLLKGASAVGVFWGRFVATHPKENASQLQQLAQWHAQGKIKAYISKQYKLSEASAALEDMANRQVHGKVVLLTEKHAKL